jgi:FkbM family methyltransferase
MKTVLVDLPGGYKVKAVEMSKSILDEIWKEKVYDRDFLIKPGTRVLDIGANQGFFSLYAAARGARVYSVEPEARNFQILQDNISGNDFDKMITPLNLAISTVEGSIDLYCPDYDQPYASGMVSTNARFMDSIGRPDRGGGEIQRVESVPLARLIDRIGQGESFDLMKIDCEGAELDILQSATAAAMRSVGNIVMETHNTYEEKDLCKIIHDLGFEILNYRKRSGLYKTGYLFARNGRSGKDSALTPLALIAAADFCLVNSPLDIDGSRSFSRNPFNGPLAFRWRIDGHDTGSGEPVLQIPFTRPGKHEIDLEVRDDAGVTDREHKDLLVLKKDYYPETGQELALDPNENERILDIDGERILSIPLPVHWQPDVFFLRIRYNGDSPRNLLFEHNGSMARLGNEINEFHYPDFPVSAGSYVFSLAADQRVSISLSCGGMDSRRFRIMKALKNNSLGGKSGVSV